jgi:hypothetical protein
VPEFSRAGGLLSCWCDSVDLHAKAASCIDRILASPAHLPAQQPTKFLLINNLKAAEALRLAIPPSVLRGDRVGFRRMSLMGQDRPIFAPALSRSQGPLSDQVADAPNQRGQWRSWVDSGGSIAVARMTAFGAQPAFSRGDARVSNAPIPDLRSGADQLAEAFDPSLPFASRAPSPTGLK